MTQNAQYSESEGREEVVHKRTGSSFVAGIARVFSLVIFCLGACVLMTLTAIESDKLNCFLQFGVLGKADAAMEHSMDKMFGVNSRRRGLWVEEVVWPPPWLNIPWNRYRITYERAEPPVMWDDTIYSEPDSLEMPQVSNEETLSESVLDDEEPGVEHGYYELEYSFASEAENVDVHTNTDPQPEELLSVEESDSFRTSETFSEEEVGFADPYVGADVLDQKQEEQELDNDLTWLEDNSNDYGSENYRYIENDRYIDDYDAEDDAENVAGDDNEDDDSNDSADSPIFEIQQENEIPPEAPTFGQDQVDKVADSAGHSYGKAEVANEPVGTILPAPHTEMHSSQSEPDDETDEMKGGDVDELADDEQTPLLSENLLEGEGVSGDTDFEKVELETPPAFENLDAEIESPSDGGAVYVPTDEHSVAEYETLEEAEAIVGIDGYTSELSLHVPKVNIQ